jgi:hypothetical protein
MTLREHVAQGAILLLTSCSMWLIAMPAPSDRWGFLVGLAAQPFWFASTIRARQWGMFANSLIYTGALVFGLWQHS